jgi:hypothetical protein
MKHAKMGTQATMTGVLQLVKMNHAEMEFSRTANSVIMGFLMMILLPMHAAPTAPCHIAEIL